MATQADTHRTSPLLAHLAHLMRSRAEAALAPLDLRPRHLVALTVLRDHGDEQQQTLAALLQIDRTNLVGLLNELEERGLILRRRATDDRRRHIVELTPAGTERLAEAECALAAVEQDVLGGLDGDEREQLYQLLRRATDDHAVGCTSDPPPCVE